MLLIACLTCLAPLGGAAQAAGIDWTQGPVTVDVADAGRIDVPDGFASIARAEDIREFVEATGELYGGGETLEIAARSRAEGHSGFCATFIYTPLGGRPEIQDARIDPAALLDGYRSGQEVENRERRGKRLTTYAIEGWAVEPHYDAATRDLEYGIRIAWYSPEGWFRGKSVNYWIKVLCAEGILEVQLSSPISQFDRELKTLREILGTFRQKAKQASAVIQPIVLQDEIRVKEPPRRLPTRPAMPRKPAPARPPAGPARVVATVTLTGVSASASAGGSVHWWWLLLLLAILAAVAVWRWARGRRVPARAAGKRTRRSVSRAGRRRSGG